MKEKKPAKAYRGAFTIAIVALVVIFIVSLGLGRFSVSPGNVFTILLAHIVPALKFKWPANAETVVIDVRLPRVVGAAVVGAALALSGATYQSVFQNPLISPDLLGVSGGASVGAAAAILFGLGGWGIQVIAFIGGVAAVALTAAIPKMVHNRSKMMLVLSGIIVSGIMTSIMGILVYSADTTSELPQITYWQMGSLAKVLPSTLVVALPIIAVAAIILIAVRWRLNVLSMGEMEAKTLGVSTTKLRNTTVVCSTLLTAASVCICGNIGWVGLVIPHFSRMIVGPENERLLPMAMIVGAVFMILVDTIARTVSASDLPLSILTGLIGAPFYFFLLKKQGVRLS